VGIGHDTHRLAAGGPLRLGGVEIAHGQHLVGHSDADVLLHALADALLGAAGLPDIGEIFPDTAAENKDRDSTEILVDVVARIHQAGYRAINVDCIVMAQEPKLSPHKEAIRHRIATLVRLEPGAVGVKAKTGEKVGPVGRQEAIDAQCVVLLAKHDTDLFG
jgi:2-C-methyl-D-erythritol 2,4-cyclodiphosphate synthase